ncbi:hypothetical protein H2202_001011 [Exophiala xenobiotica]|nr:hypothetical protein H2202_001011 [Exophiala xenobiotica]KAK5226428.1 hypothetical protein LTR47_009106 [Exophiala xenobiotica]KAK5253922.1 hypothetical protein LTS06_001728 [Exophiala xenobiotica]KAK5284504.1 hypothetical protein LTR40_000174 [Exophiala xenobiotica]KAK5330393.1 hypothetical protein LTR93_001982 [Exophiala xenobiotica]
MDPLSISASAVALITVCVETVKVIKNTVETVKTAKRELLNILNATNRVRLLLEQLRGLTHQLGSQNNQVLLAFDKSGCEEVLGDLRRLVNKLAQVDKFVGFQFLVRRSKIEALVAGLRTQEDGIRTVLLSVATESAVFTREYVQILMNGANVQAVSISSITQSSNAVSDEPPPPFAEHAEPTVSSDDTTGVAATSSSSVAPTNSKTTESTTESTTEGQSPEDMIALAENDLPATPGSDRKGEPDTDEGLWSPLTKYVSNLWQSPSIASPIGIQGDITAPFNLPAFARILSGTSVWHGQLTRYLCDDGYLKLRDGLADAAYYGNWQAIEEILEDAERVGFRSWPNCYRIGSWRGPSGWTPLHQAAFLGAPTFVVKMLLVHGASRMQRTLWTSSSELPHKSMTALEMARFLGFRHLYDVLSPVLHHTIPHATLDKLQQNFHELIRGHLAGLREGANLRLPELELLIELQNPEMYFPLKPPKLTMGYFYRLDGRELLVTALGIPSPSRPRHFRISERGAQEIQDAVLFDME